MSGPASPPTPNPWLILAAGIAIPGAGHVLLGLAQRGLAFLFFIAVFGWIGLRLSPENASFFARNAGGILIWGFGALDAYRIARVRQEMARHSASRREVL